MSSRPQRALGVEEELVLVDPETRRVTAVADQAQAANETPTEVGLLK